MIFIVRFARTSSPDALCRQASHSALFSPLLPQGGFAKCYELKNMTTKEVLAGKVVAKSQLKKSDQKEKICQEITIHRSLKHKHIVGFHDYFEDSHHIYIILEICNKRVSGGRSKCRAGRQTD